MKEYLLKKLQTLSKEDLINVVEWMLEQEDVINGNPDECFFATRGFCSTYKIHEYGEEIEIPEYCSAHLSMNVDGDTIIEFCERENPAECWVFRAIQMTRGL